MLIDDCEFSNNNIKEEEDSPIECGVLRMLNSDYVKIVDSKFSENYGNNKGGGVISVTETKEVYIDSCYFTKNSGLKEGGAI